MQLDNPQTPCAAPNSPHPAAAVAHLQAPHVGGVVQRLQADLAACRQQRLEHALVSVYRGHSHMRVPLRGMDSGSRACARAWLNEPKKRGTSSTSGTSGSGSDIPCAPARLAGMRASTQQPAQAACLHEGYPKRQPQAATALNLPCPTWLFMPAASGRSPLRSTRRTSSTSPVMMLMDRMRLTACSG